jgi:hypothetical protein
MSLFRNTLFTCTMLIMLVSLFGCTTVEIAGDAEHTAEAAATIADFEPPAGYTPEFSSSLQEYTLVSYKGPNAPSHLYVIQSTKESDGEELERMLTQLTPGSSDRDSRMTVVENRSVTIRGREATMIVSEGINSENVSYRQVSVAFDGKGGPALLVLSELAEDWDQTAVDGFLASIH